MHVVLALVLNMDLIRIDVATQNGGVSVGTFVNFVWVTIEEKILSDHISAKKAGKELKPTGMVRKNSNLA